LIEQPTYVQQLPNGAFGLCSEPEATGIAYEGKAYHLEGRAEMGDAETVSLIAVDAGEVANEQAAGLTSALLELTNTQLALCEVYELLTGGDDNG
jgi:hypothetical protein